jgi:hypothetical protein
VALFLEHRYPSTSGEASQMPAAAMYRAKAEEMRNRAKSAHDPVAHQELLSLAVKYEVLARSAELK